MGTEVRDTIAKQRVRIETKLISAMFEMLDKNEPWDGKEKRARRPIVKPSGATSTVQE